MERSICVAVVHPESELIIDVPPARCIGLGVRAIYVTPLQCVAPQPAVVVPRIERRPGSGPDKYPKVFFSHGYVWRSAHGIVLSCAPAERKVDIAVHRQPNTALNSMVPDVEHAFARLTAFRSYVDTRIRPGRRTAMVCQPFAECRRRVTKVYLEFGNEIYGGRHVDCGPGLSAH